MPLWFYSDGAIRCVYQGQVDGALSGSLTVPASPCMIVIVAEWQPTSTGGLSAATIAGHSATIVKSQIDGGNTGAIVAAMVNPGDSGSFSITPVTSVFSSRAEVYIYEVYNVEGVNVSSSAGSNAAAPTATLTIPANCVVIAGAKSQGGTGVSCSGITLDVSTVAGSQTYSAAHSVFTSANASLTVTFTFTGSPSTELGAFAVFVP